MGGFAPRLRAKVNPQSPRAFAICDRCGFLYNHSDLSWDTQWMGNQIKRTGFLVCQTCVDVPNPTLRPIRLPADPVPILNPRPEAVHCHVFGPRADADAGSNTGTSDWILETGFWDDDGHWIDEATWND
jgi:hypothetical protein